MFTDRVGRMFLHHRDVFVGRCVEDDVRPFAGDEPHHRRLARNVREMRSKLAETRVPPELPFELTLHQVQRALRPIDEYQAPWSKLKNLASELRPDRSTRARDENRLIANDVVDR
jgi:hypothetical protein